MSEEASDHPPRSHGRVAGCLSVWLCFPSCNPAESLPCGSKASWHWYLEHILAGDFCVIGMSSCVTGIITELLRDFCLRLSISQNCKNQFAYVNNLILSCTCQWKSDTGIIFCVFTDSNDVVTKCPYGKTFKFQSSNWDHMRLLSLAK